MKILYLEDKSDIEEIINALNNIHPNDFNSATLDFNFDHILCPVSRFFSSTLSNDRSFLVDLGWLKIDRFSNEVLINSTPIILPKKEHELLTYLVSQSPRIVSKDKIFIQIWRKYEGITSNTIDVHINKLRRKIGKEHIICIRGFGYKFIA